MAHSQVRTRKLRIVNSARPVDPACMLFAVERAGDEFPQLVHVANDPDSAEVFLAGMKFAAEHFSEPGDIEFFRGDQALCYKDAVRHDRSLQ